MNNVILMSQIIGEYLVLFKYAACFLDLSPKILVVPPLKTQIKKFYIKRLFGPSFFIISPSF